MSTRHQTLWIKHLKMRIHSVIIHTSFHTWFISRVPNPLTCSVEAMAQNAISPNRYNQMGRKA